ncbi:transposon Tf2-11 polyprotein [Trichonephila clavipes]|nr:transposon Tf2-11 polyprotein [Trichonephila clavipes]
MISLDTVGGFNYHNSQKKYLHIVLDHATRYAWTFPSKSVTSETYTNCLKQIFSIQCPKQLLSDRNAAFTSSKFKKFLKHHNIRQLLTSANRPQCNGKNERVNQTLVAKLRCKVNSTTKTPWTNLLEQVTYEYNNSPHDVTGFPPAYLMFGTLPYDSPLPNQSELANLAVPDFSGGGNLSGATSADEGERILGRTWLVSPRCDVVFGNARLRGKRSAICQVIYSQFGLAIHHNDHQARRRFVEWAQNEIAVVPDFHKRILFSDEAHFWLNGYVNKQNCRIWCEANPQVYVETPLHPEKLTVWSALWAGGILLQKR